MNQLEAVKLCRLIASLCPGQKFDEYTPDAYAIVLDDIAYADAVAAVRTIYRDLGNDEEWGTRKIEADDVIRQVKRVRNEVIAKKIADYVPPSGMDPQQYLVWYRDLAKRLGDGEEVVQDLPQLKARVIPVLGRRMDDDDSAARRGRELVQAALEAVRASHQPEGTTAA